MTTDHNKSWTGQWVAQKMQSHEEVTSANLLSPEHVQLVRKTYSPVVIGTTAVERLDSATLSRFLGGEPAVSFIVNIPKESYVTGDALKSAANSSIPIGGLGDLMRAVNLPDIRHYVNPEFNFVERGLTQHFRVKRFDRLDDRRYLVVRQGLSDVTVVFLNEYELTADHLRTARSRYGHFKMVVLTNPNGSATSSAKSVASTIGCQLYKWENFMGALNRE